MILTTVKVIAKRYQPDRNGTSYRTDNLPLKRWLEKKKRMTETEGSMYIQFVHW